MQIGTFIATANGFAGRLSTLTIERDLAFVEADTSDRENAPDYRVLSGSGEESLEVGAGWKRTGEKAGAYVAVQLNDPAFVRPLRANLFQGDGNSHVLVWSRPTKREAAS